MPITTTALPLPHQPLPDVPQVCRDLRTALATRRVFSRDVEFLTSLLGAHESNRATDRQTEFLERLWIRYVDNTPFPPDVRDGVQAVTNMLRTPGMDMERRRFIEDILHAVTGRTPSVAQWGAFTSLVERAEREAAAAQPAAAPAAAAAVTVPAARLYDMFAAAAAQPSLDGRTRRVPRLQFPGMNIWLDQRDGSGTITLSRPHVDPARRTRLARILADGSVVGGLPHRGSLLTEEQMGLVRRLCENPEETLAAEGRRTGVCCMCGRGLTDERSVNLGMGPVCATRWGLSHAWLNARGVNPAAHRQQPTRMVRVGTTPPPLATVDVSSLEARVMAHNAQTPPAPTPGTPGWMRPANAPDQEDF